MAISPSTANLAMEAHLPSNDELQVLLVEDERTLSGIVRDALETMDFTVEQAYDGSEGLRRYFEKRPDILVVDVMMRVLGRLCA